LAIWKVSPPPVQGTDGPSCLGRQQGDRGGSRSLDPNDIECPLRPGLQQLLSPGQTQPDRQAEYLRRQASHYDELASHYRELAKLHRAQADYLDPRLSGGVEEEPSESSESPFGGLKTAFINKTMGDPESAQPNTSQALQTLKEMKLVELVPGKVIQHWRFTARGLASNVNVLPENATRQRAALQGAQSCSGGRSDECRSTLT
jgi:hypothetical protein